MSVPMEESGDMPDAWPSGRGYGIRPAAPSPLPPDSYLTEAYKDLEDEHFEYHMRHKSRGYAIIINNEKFDPRSGMSDRSGSSVDRDKLIIALRFLGFTDDRVQVYNNVKGDAMIGIMKDVAKKDFTDCDCLFVALLSHGEENRIYGVDRDISYEHLMEPLKAPEAKTLIGKPKIFVIQACRGEKLDEGRELQHDAFPTAEKLRGTDVKKYFISKESDFLLAYSVVPGYYSWRNCANGSWFIQAFCEVVRRDGRRLEFVLLLTRVNRVVSYTFKSNASSLSMTDKKQCPCIMSMLTKALYFS